jgi:hypothetical protein
MKFWPMDRRQATDASVQMLVLSLVLATTLARCNPASAQTTVNGHVLTKTTAQRLSEKGWWPTKPGAGREEYVGTSLCASCHRQIALSQQETPMAHAASRARETEVLRLNPSLSFSTPPYQTVITSDGSASTYMVVGGGDSMKGQIRWSMGDGVKGQTFILRYLGILFESQLSYFPSIKGLDVTPEHPRRTPESLEFAFGAPLTTKAAQQCFACHTTASTARSQFDPDHATPGVTCEACHGPGMQHVKRMKAKQISQGLAAILDPTSFDPPKIVDFCGACHRAPSDVAAAQDYVPLNVRFQPYRLSKSPCWSRPDQRITCIACHNPHERLVQDDDFYDAKCVACHSGEIASPSYSSGKETQPPRPPTCPVSTGHCVSCHMPKYKDPQFHGSFTDHDIRIVRPGDPYPL